MKKIIFLSALFFAIIAGAILSCTKSDVPQSKSKSKPKGQLITTTEVQYPLRTKFQKSGESGIYALINDDMIINITNAGVLDDVSEAYITYFFDEAAQQDKAYLIVIGNKNSTATAHSFELLVNGDGYFEVQDPVNTPNAHTIHECKGSCTNCQFVRDGNNAIKGCTTCTGTCMYSKTVTAQEGLSTSDGLSGAALIVAIIAVIIAL